METPAVSPLRLTVDAVPAATGDSPGIVVIHEIFGLNDHIRDVARRLAKVGYRALAPDLASRAGGSETTNDVVGALTGGKVEDRVADLQATAAHLADLQTQDRYGVHYLRYWVDEVGGRIHCLVDAPDAEAANRVHREAHGLVADSIVAVVEGA